VASAEVVRARIDADLKREVSAVLAEMGLSVSDAIRLLFVRVAAERALPFDIRVPNAQTQEAMRAVEAGKVERFDSVADLMRELEG
jgi:DNA-damage-inducible protein J